MQIQPITANQQNFRGKVIFEKGTTANLTGYTPDPLWQKFKDIANLIAEKPYDIFIYRNANNPEFYDVAVNKSLEEAKKVKGYTVKVHEKSIVNSIIDASKDAMEMYEKYISKSIKG